MVSTKGRYALRVMLDLAEHNSGAYIPLSEISRRQGISMKYLEIILKTLEDMDPQYPELPEEDAEQLPRLKAGLENGEYDEDAIREAEKKTEKQK